MLTYIQNQIHNSIRAATGLSGAKTNHIIIIRRKKIPSDKEQFIKMIFLSHTCFFLYIYKYIYFEIASFFFVAKLTDARVLFFRMSLIADAFYSICCIILLYAKVPVYIPPNDNGGSGWSLYTYMCGGSRIENIY